MSVEGRLERLRVRHAELDQLLHDEEMRPHPDDTTVHAIKKEKLRVKDEMSRMDA